MKRTFFPFALTALLSVSVLFTGCSSSKPAASSKTTEGPVLLQYLFSSKTPLSYAQTSVSDQYMDVQGQTVSVSTTAYLGFGLKNFSSNQGLFECDVVLDSMNVQVASPMADNMSMGSNIKGKSFRMSVKPSGKTVSTGTASSIDIGGTATGAGDLGATFSEIFPTLPLKEVSQGMTWTSGDTVHYKGSAMDSNTLSKATIPLPAMR